MTRVFHGRSVRMLSGAGTAARAAALPAALAWLPWRLFFEFPFKDICPLVFPTGQQQPAYHLFWLAHNFVSATKRTLSLLSIDARPWAFLLCSSIAGSDPDPEPPHPMGTHCQGLQPLSSDLGSTILHTPTPVLLLTGFVHFLFWSSRFHVIVLSVF